MRLWITTDPYPDVTPETAAAAEQAGAAIIVHGVPQRLAGIVADDAVGLVEVPDEPEPVDLADVPDLPADPDLIPPDPTRLRSPR